MGRPRSETRGKAFQLWAESGGNIKLIDLAAELGIPDSRIRKWKTVDKWDQKLKGALQNSKGSAPKRSGPPKGNRNAATGKEDVKGTTTLTDKQVVFVAEYLTDFNATRAAMAVGYSKRSAYSIGWENLRKPEIKAEIRRQKELIAGELGITSQRVLLEYLKIAFADITNYVDFGQKEVDVMGMFGPVKDEEGNTFKKTVNYVAFKEGAEIDGTLISEVKQGKEGVSIKLHDKMKALEKVEKYLDLLPDHHKRMIEEKKLELAREQLELEKAKTEKPGDVDVSQYVEALKGVAEEVWQDDGVEEE